ncbi:hypothetical protein BDR07DRAFT_921294 [Suillus spraguei]|nr:hypothetical protein BDR07DRAFT_921294 [Suillus spraguei]
MEIKPKWRFLPTECHFSPETVALKTATCRFCALKWNKGVSVRHIVPWTSFPAMRRVLEGFWVLCGLGGMRAMGLSITNNLRFFVEGRMAKPDDDHSMQLLALFTANKLTDIQNLGNHPYLFFRRHSLIVRSSRSFKTNTGYPWCRGFIQVVHTNIVKFPI